MQIDQLFQQHRASVIHLNSLKEAAKTIKKKDSNFDFYRREYTFQKKKKSINKLS
jgi:hypothetical protein